MVRRSTWIVLGIFVILIGFTVVFQRYQANKAGNSATATPTTPPVYLNNLGESEIKDIKIADNTGSYIDLYRDPASSNWAIEGVPAEQADSAKIQSISDELASLQVQETLTETISLASVGLETPAYTITLTTSNDSQSVTYVGTQTAIGSGYYVRENDGQIMIVDKSSLDNILNLLKEPPLMPTASPQVTPTGTISPTAPVNQETPTP
jgi:hypothetical protein